ncbi:unnamed protein product [Cladocopium goreaui]|uniref:Uncharacterized protein n=1 Tax=Cladocopium goreaui TaxID=2562237 RepID=A0A9P1FZG9_9DINO|nr:unnamed protein product [Cladocopium goreaui]
MKGTTDPEEVSNHSPVVELLDAIYKLMQAEAPEPEVEEGDSVVAADLDADTVLADHEVALKQLVPAPPEGTSTDELQEHLIALQKKVKQFSKFVPMSNTARSLALKLEATAVAGTALRKFHHAVLVYDSKVLGEASSHAHVRIPPFQAAHLKTVVQAWIQARGKKSGDEDELGIVLVLDGFRPGLESSIGAAFVGPDGKNLQKNRVLFSVKYTEESLLSRKQLQRGLLQQVEACHCFTTDGLALRRKLRLFNDKESNMASMLGEFALPKHEDLWRVAPDVKKEMIGCKILTGGANPNKVPKPVFGDGKEPVSWHCQAETFFAEVTHSFYAGVILHATETDGSCAVHCVKHQIPYVGIALTQKHADLLQAQVLTRLWHDSLDDKSPIYNASLANLLAGSEKKKNEGQKKTPKKTRSRRGGADATGDESTAEPKAKSKPKRTKDDANTTTADTEPQPKKKTKKTKSKKGAQEPDDAEIIAQLKMLEARDGDGDEEDQGEGEE